MKKYHSYLPHPGSTDWGRGVIVVTTNEDRVIRHNDCAECIKIEELSKEDAITLLKNMSERPQEEGDIKVLFNSNDVKRYPLDVVR